uniref:Uncharacterized protein n=1 Tax=Globodera rostochiensis TaxID=31243 RepID=A0A914GTX3_GLORO
MADFKSLKVRHKLCSDKLNLEGEGMAGGARKKLGGRREEEQIAAKYSPKQTLAEKAESPPGDVVQWMGWEGRMICWKKSDCAAGEEYQSTKKAKDG